MPERRHISDQSWQESQRLLTGHETTERIAISSSRAVTLKRKLRENIVSGLILGAGISVTSVVLNMTDNGPEWLQKGSLYFVAMMALGSALAYKEDVQKSEDWQEIANREVAGSRIAIAQEDRTLARAIYESELKITTVDEIANIKQVLNHLRRKNLLVDQSNPETNKEQL